MRVFLVDDTKIMRTRIAAMIGKIEEVELVGQAVSIAEATAGIAAMQPDLVVVDVDLTDGNGLVVLEFAKRRSRPPAVVMISAHQDAIYRERSLAAGADRFLDKTTELDQLPTVLRRFAFDFAASSVSQSRP